MTQTMPEKLELIAKCIREGREVQVTNSHNDWVISQMVHNDNGFIQVFDNLEYRAKPDKPRVGMVKEFATVYKSVELTPEVCQALDDAGIEY